MTALPRPSDIDLLSDGERVIDLDAKVPDRALHLGMAEEQLNHAEVSGSPIDQSRLGSTQRVSASSASAILRGRSDGTRFLAWDQCGFFPTVTKLRRAEHPQPAAPLGLRVFKPPVKHHHSCLFWHSANK